MFTRLRAGAAMLAAACLAWLLYAHPASAQTSTVGTAQTPNGAKVVSQPVQIMLPNATPGGPGVVVDASHPLPVDCATCTGGGGGGSGGTEYTEDAPATANPIGGILICVRRDTLSAAEVSADGDNIALKCTAKGQAQVRAVDLEGLVGEVQASPTANTVLDRLKTVHLDILSLNATLGAPLQEGGTIGNTVFGATQSGAWNITNITGTISLPTNASTATGQATTNSSLSTISGQLPSSLGQKTGANSVSIVPASDAALPVKGICNVSIPTVSDGATITLQTDCHGSLKTVGVDSSGNILDTNAPVAVTATQIGEVQSSPTSFTVLDRLKTINATLAPMLYAQGSTTSGQTGPLIQCAITTSNPSYTTATTNPISCTTSGGIRANLVGTNPVSGAGAHGSAISGNPNRMGCRARTALYSALSSDQTADCISTLGGAIVVRPYTLPNQEWSANISLSDGTSTALHASCGAGLINYITWVSYSTVTATTAVTLSLLDGSSSKFDDDVTAGAGHQRYEFPTPIAGTAATAFNAQLSGSPTGAVKVRAGGYCAY